MASVSNLIVAVIHVTGDRNTDQIAHPSTETLQTIKKAHYSINFQLMQIV